MPLLEPVRITERTVLRVLVAGFALVVVLLGAAGVVAMRGTRSIEGHTAQVVREQLVIAKLLNEVQAGQNTLAAVLHRIAHQSGGAGRETLLKELETADASLARVAATAESTPEAPRWRQFNQAVRRFSAGVRDSLHRPGPLPPSAMAELLALHDEVVRMEQGLLESSEKRVAETGIRIEDESRELSRSSQWLLGACLALALICAALTVNFARSSIRRIEWQGLELSRVSWHMLQSQESTARRFSHEVHDELGQSLAAVKANLTSATARDWNVRRSDCVSLVDEAIANVRELSQLLRPVILDDFGLDAGLRWLTERFAQRTGIAADYASDFLDRLPDEVETHLFRIAQEALTNVARHSGATRVAVALQSSHGRVCLAIDDNGHGMPEADKRSTSLGMTGMRARAGQAGGAFRLLPSAAGGVRIEVEVPLSKREENHAEQEDTYSVGG